MSDTQRLNEMTEASNAVDCAEATQSTETTKVTPKVNLYETTEGWLLVAALPEVNRDQVEITTEGTTLHLLASRERGDTREELSRAFAFPKDTRWGELNAHWEGDLLHVELNRATPEKRVVTIA